jgi:L-iditol 2-dehydrogenase
MEAGRPARRERMRVLRLHAARLLKVHEEPDPVPAPGEELVRITAVGLCGSDLHWYEDAGIGDAKLARALVLGHEIGGVIAAGPCAGLRVAVDPADPCERCEACVAGHANLCPTMRFSGHGTTDGALRELMAWPTRLLHAVPDAITDSEVPLLEPLGVAIHAIELGHFRAGMRAGVYGCGPIGLLLIAALRAMGASEIVATEPLPHRRAAAEVMGATAVWPVDDDGVSAEATRHMVDVAFETAGEDGAVATAVAAVRLGGRVVLEGIPPTDRTTFAASVARRKGISLVLSRRMKAHHLARATALVDAGLVPLAPIISARYPLHEGERAFAGLARRDGLKVVIEPSA